jgi:hypothetical protein
MIVATYLITKHRTKFLRKGQPLFFFDELDKGDATSDITL